MPCWSGRLSGGDAPGQDHRDLVSTCDHNLPRRRDLDVHGCNQHRRRWGVSAVSHLSKANDWILDITRRVEKGDQGWFRYACGVRFVTGHIISHTTYQISGLSHWAPTGCTIDKKRFLGISAPHRYGSAMTDLHIL